MPFAGGQKNHDILSAMKQQIDCAGLTKEALIGRLSSLLGTERKVLVEFLQYLAEFDKREAYLEMGYGSLFDYCVKKLHLSKGSAYRRTIGSRLMRMFPGVADYLTDGRISLSTLVVFKNVLNEKNLDTILAQAAYKTKESAELIAAQYSTSVELPRNRESVRKLGSPKIIILEVSRKIPETTASIGLPPARSNSDGKHYSKHLALPAPCIKLEEFAEFKGTQGSDRQLVGEPSVENKTSVAYNEDEKSLYALISRQKPDEVKAISEDLRVLKVTVSKEFIEELKQVRELLSHKFPYGSFEEVLREGLKLIRQKYERSLVRQDTGVRAANVVSPTAQETQVVFGVQLDLESTPQASGFPLTSLAENRSTIVPVESITGESSDSSSASMLVVSKPESEPRSENRFPGEPSHIGKKKRYIPRSIKREVWARSGGTCTHQGTDGTSCQSRWQLEFEHIIPVAKGGKSTIDNITLLCNRHNLWRAKQEFGDNWMSQFTRTDQIR